MRQQRSVLAAGLLAVVTVATVSGCGLLPRSSFEDEANITEAVTAVRFDSDNGQVTVRGGQNNTEVSVHRRVEYRGSRPEDATYRVDDGELVLTSCGRRCSVHYTVELPAGVPVSGRTSNGAIDLTRVGDVDVRTSNGRIEIILDTPQNVQAQTSNGAIRLTVPDGSYRVSTSTSNGRTDVEVDDDPAGEHRLDLTTSNGNITVRAG